MKAKMALLLCSLSLSAQDRYVLWGKNMDVCPLQEQRGSSPFHPVENYTWTTGTTFFPWGKRKDVSQFSVQEESGKTVPMRDLRGKPIIIGLWSTHCEPSLFLLGEMAQLHERTAKFGFEVFPTNFDSERWKTIRPFLNQKRMQEMLKGITIFTPALGHDGVHLFMDVVPALPTFFLVDREGRVAVQSFGYKAGELSKWLKVILAETPPQGMNPASVSKNPLADPPKE